MAERPTVELPLIIVVATSSRAGSISALFAGRGFATRVFASPERLVQYLVEGSSASAAVIDMDLAGAEAALRALRALQSAPVLVGVVKEADVARIQDQVDATFAPPVDPARLFVRVVALVAERKSGKRRRARITGVVGLVEGNELFHKACCALHDVVSPVNASAILEKALADLGAHPETLTLQELAAMLATGWLARALGPFGDPSAQERAFERLRLLAGREPYRSP